MDIASLIVGLDKREKQIEQKLTWILEQNPNPFPFERINKAKKLLGIIYQCRQHLKNDEWIEAGKCVRDLELEGLEVTG
jgi:hypothetical protein